MAMQYTCLVSTAAGAGAPAASTHQVASSNPRLPLLLQEHHAPTQPTASLATLLLLLLLQGRPALNCHSSKLTASRHTTDMSSPCAGCGRPCGEGCGTQATGSGTCEEEGCGTCRASGIARGVAGSHCGGGPAQCDPESGCGRGRHGPAPGHSLGCGACGLGQGWGCGGDSGLVRGCDAEEGCCVHDLQSHCQRTGGRQLHAGTAPLSSHDTHPAS
mmetsp:Transcript_23029/g.50547  ORF Transcript_23029/g.50547 Transcript_23029/m.50547 type:complete len:216 (+) Transcript_23029:677-1324(+)